MVEKKKEIFRYTLIRGIWHKEAVSELTRSKASYVIGLVCIFGFL